ncbi:MAG: hypothetical protein AB8E15_08455 [Bdellovibrionales bacterium]
MKWMQLYILILVLGACSLKVKKVELEETNAGFYAPKLITEKSSIDLPELRDENKELITERKRAEDRLSELRMKDADLSEMFNPKCKFDDQYEASLHLYSAWNLSVSGSFTESGESLEAASSVCEDIEYISMYHYIAAFNFQNQNLPEQRNNSLNRFLKRSPQFLPNTFYKKRNGREIPGLKENSQKWYSIYSKNAKEVLSGKIEKLSLEKQEIGTLVAKFPENEFFRPGKNMDPDNMFMFMLLNYEGFEYSTGGFYGLRLGDFYLSTAIKYAQLSGLYYNIELHRPFYESVNRDTNMSFFVGALNRKLVNFDLNPFSLVASNGEVLEEKISPKIGLGITRRFNPTFGLAMEAKHIFNDVQDRDRTLGTAYLFYDFTPGFEVFTGYLNDAASLGIRLQATRIYYNFDIDQITVTFGEQLVY